MTAPAPEAGERTSAPTSPHITMPAAAFYWGVIARHGTASIGGRYHQGRAGRREIEYLFEDVLPVPIEDVATAFVRCGSRIVACGLGRDLARVHAERGARTLSPDGAPEWILEELAGEGASALDPRALNVLTGESEPPGLRRARRRAVLHIAVITATLVSVICVGTERRVRLVDRQRAESEARATAAYARVLPHDGSRQPPAVRLASELRTLERLTSRPSSGQPRAGQVSPPADDFDAGASLAALLVRVPSMTLWTDSIDVLPSRMVLTAAVPTTDDAQRLAAAWDSPPTRERPWRLRQPSVTSERGPDGTSRIRVGITLDRAEPAGRVEPAVGQGAAGSALATSQVRVEAPGPTRGGAGPLSPTASSEIAP